MREKLFGLRLPLAIFILIILILNMASAAIFYSVFTAHVYGEYFNMETSHFSLYFPRNWIAASGRYELDYGTRNIVWIAPIDKLAFITLAIMDKKSTESYMEKNNLTDAYSIMKYEIGRIYDSILKRNKNATLRFIGNGTIKAAGYSLNYISFIIINGYIDNEGKHYNWTWMFMTSIINGELLQIIYHAIGDDYKPTYPIFQSILNRTKVKWG